jgi:hypothetical protein
MTSGDSPTSCACSPPRGGPAFTVTRPRRFSPWPTLRHGVIPDFAAGRLAPTLPFGRRLTPWTRILGVNYSCAAATIRTVHPPF